MGNILSGGELAQGSLRLQQRVALATGQNSDHGYHCQEPETKKTT